MVAIYLINKQQKKSESEYEKYRVIQDQEYISSMDKFYNKYLEENKSAINDIK